MNAVAADLPPVIPQPVARFEARISPTLHAMLKRAAQIQGRTMTDFAIDALQLSAKKAIEDASVLHLSLQDQLKFAEVLINPPVMNAALKKGFAAHKRLIKSSVA